ncbi:MAG: hypothetical protein ACFCD0_14300 [Gemmataceae bacterium]
MQDPNHTSHVQADLGSDRVNELLLRLQDESAWWKFLTLTLAFMLVFLIGMVVVWTFLQRQEIQNAREQVTKFEQLANEAQELAKQQKLQTDIVREQLNTVRKEVQRTPRLPKLTDEQTSLINEKLTKAYRNFVEAVEQSDGASAHKLLHSAPILYANPKLDEVLRDAIDRLVKSKPD